MAKLVSVLSSVSIPPPRVDIGVVGQDACTSVSLNVAWMGNLFDISSRQLQLIVKRKNEFRYILHDISK